MKLRVLFAASLLWLGLAGVLSGQVVPTPIFTSMSPSQTTAGVSGVTLTIVGGNFSANASTVLWNDTTLPTSFVSSTQLTATVSAALLASPGTASVNVFNFSTGSTTPRTFTINPQPVITTTSLNAMRVGVVFSQTLAASLGTPPYSNWRVVEGVLPAGLNLNANTGVISGTPTVAGSDMAQVYVDDSAGVTASQFYNWTVNPAVLTITTNTPLPGATAGTSYSQTFVVTGGISPYAWSSSGTLPPGLTLSTTGVLSGTPTQLGTSNFTVRVADQSGSFTTKLFSLTVTVPAPSTLSIAGLTDTVSPAQQPTFDVLLSAAYPLAITGTVTLTFAPNAVNAVNDPAVQFSGGGRTLNFAIAAGQTRAFPTTLPSIQTGTVAGQIDLTLSFSASGQDITPTPAPVRSVTVARAAPKINSVQVVRVTGGFNILVTGYSTPRQVTQAVFTFTPATGANLQTTQVTVPVDSAFTTWYTGTSSAQFGSAFLYTQPFTVQGNVNDITSVSVTLSNATGTSAAVSASF